MISQRLSPALATTAIAIVFTACSGSGAPISAQSAGGSQSNGFVPQSGSAETGSATTMSAFPQPLSEPALIALGPSLSPNLTKPIVDDSGAYTNGPIIRATNTTTGYGMEGVVDGSGAGVYGHASYATAYGVYGSSQSGVGVYGYATKAGRAIVGLSAQGYGVEGVTKSSGSNGGYFTNTAGGTALYATSAGNAISGSNTDGEFQAAIVGTTASPYDQGTNAGVEGVDNSNTTCGSACLNFGVEGISNNAGYALYGISNGGAGVYADGGTGIGVDAFTGGANGTALYVASNGSAGQKLIVANVGGAGDVMSLDTSGNLTISGTLTQNGTPLISSAGGAAQIESVGDAQLGAGSAYVAIDPAFAKHLDPSRTYHVFLTPNGDSNGLYVTGKTATGFTVRESRHGASSIAFDYRIVGTARHVAMPNWVRMRVPPPPRVRPSQQRP